MKLCETSMTAQVEGSVAAQVERLMASLERDTLSKMSSGYICCGYYIIIFIIVIIIIGIGYVVVILTIRVIRVQAVVMSWVRISAGIRPCCG